VLSPAGVSYQIEHGTAPSTYGAVVRVGAGITSFDVTGLTPGVRYYFVVRSVDSAGVRSGPSNEVSAVAPISTTSPPPTDGGTTPDPPPTSTTTTTVQVASESALRTALGALKSKTIIKLATGTYQLTRPLVVTGGLTDVEIRSSTGRAADVVLVGPPATSTDPRPAAILVTRLTNFKLSYVTIRNTPGYAVSLGAGVSQPKLVGVRIQDDGEFVQSLSSDAGGVARGLIDSCTFEYVGAGKNFPVGIDIRAGNNWTLRRNTFTDALPTTTITFGPAILAWQGSVGTVVERNVFVNTTLEIVLGLDDRFPDQHTSGVVRNNMIVRKSGTGARGAAISVLDSHGTIVVHNTVLLLGTSATAIDYAHPDSQDLYIANNLVDGKIAGRDGATAIREANLTTATASMFVAAAKGDLRLRADTGKAAINVGLATPFAPTDAAGQARPNAGGTDVGADEYHQ
jgi:hypothetical protein